MTSTPWSRTRPSVGSSKPAIIRRVVVLPEPDGPSIEKNSPSRTSRSTWSTAASRRRDRCRARSGRHAPAGRRGRLREGLEPDAGRRRRGPVGAGIGGDGGRCGSAKRVLGLGPGRRPAGTGGCDGSAPAPPRERCRTVRCALAPCQDERGPSRGAVTRRSRPRLPPCFAPSAASGRSPPPAGRRWSRSPSVGCDAGAAAADPADRARARRPRRARSTSSLKDWIFLPDPVDVVPGETVLLHVVNGGLEIHEARHRRPGRPGRLGGRRGRDDRRAARPDAASSASPPDGRRHPGRRPVRASGSTSPGPCRPTAADVAKLLLGCHIPGHWAKGMRAGRVTVAAPPRRLVEPRATGRVAARRC